jgi:hypothetical protein
MNTGDGMCGIRPLNGTKKCDGDSCGKNHLTTSRPTAYYPHGVTAYYPFNGVPIAVNQCSSLSYLHHDHLGSLVSLTDASGTEQWWGRYAPLPPPLARSRPARYNHAICRGVPGTAPQFEPRSYP